MPAGAQQGAERQQQQGSPGERRGQLDRLLLGGQAQVDGVGGVGQRGCVAGQRNGKYYLKTASSSQKSSQASPSKSSPAKASMSTQASGIAGGIAGATGNTAAPGPTHSKPVKEEARADSPVKEELPKAAIPAKRSASSMAPSRDPTPGSKKARSNDHAAKKAELLREREE